MQAHFCLVTERIEMIIISNMKKANQNLDLIKAEIQQQRLEILSICDRYNISSSALAAKAGLAPSTVNKVLNEEEPGNALSAVTMRKIRSAFGVSSGFDTKGGMSDREYGLIGMIHLLFSIVIARGAVTPENMKELLNQQMQYFRAQNRPGAIEIAETLISSLQPRPYELDIQAIQKFLSPAQV